MKGSMLGLEVVGQSAGEELVKCPFHDDSHASASWNPKKNLFYCFTCGFGLNAQQLLDKTGYKVELGDEVTEEAPKLDLSRSTERFFTPGLFHYHSYLKSRGISRETCGDYGVTASECEDVIYFPVTDVVGKTVGRISRVAYHTKGIRYIKVGKQTPVWPMDLIGRLCYGEWIIVTEGLFSCLRIASVDSRMICLSLAGARANKSIAATLAPFNPIFIYDRDVAGMRAAGRMKKLLPDSIVLTAGVPPDEMMDDSKIRKLVDKIFKLGVDKVSKV